MVYNIVHPKWIIDYNRRCIRETLMYCILHSICAYMRSFGMQLLLVHQSFEGFFSSQKRNLKERRLLSISVKKVCNKSNFCVGEKVGKKKYRIEAKAIKCNQLCIGNDVGLSIKLPNLSQDIFSLQSNALPASIKIE